jgi:hypothetical protein
MKVVGKFEMFLLVIHSWENDKCGRGVPQYTAGWLNTIQHQRYTKIVTLLEEPWSWSRLSWAKPLQRSSRVVHEKLAFPVWCTFPESWFSGSEKSITSSLRTPHQTPHTLKESDLVRSRKRKSTLMDVDESRILYSAVTGNEKRES